MVNLGRKRCPRDSSVVVVDGGGGDATSQFLPFPPKLMPTDNVRLCDSRSNSPPCENKENFRETYFFHVSISGPSEHWKGGSNLVGKRRPT